MSHRWIAAALCAFLSLALAPPAAADGNEGNDWQTLGLLRVRDLTPFGIARLDMLPAHAVASTPGTFAVELTAAYQNTWITSGSVKDYLEARGIGRREITAADVAAIIVMPGEAYLVDGELGLVDLTLHYRATRHFALYATVPYYTTSGGFLDSTIEGFHEAIGNSTMERDRVPRDRFLVIADLERATVVLDEAPPAELGDPVLGVRYALDPASRRWNLIVEGAAKVVLDHGDRIVSTGTNDYGVQVSLQRFFRRQALYLSLAEVYYQGPDRSLTRDRLVPTVVAGWERRLTRHTNVILQAAASRGTISETRLDELRATKIQATVGLQRIYRGAVLRFGITENIANFDNTPDIGVNVSLARIVFGKRDLDPDLAVAFPTSESVNTALRMLVDIAEATSRRTKTQAGRKR